MLECNLIKEHRPKYNTMLKDDKTYPYIKVTLGEAYPRVLFSRQMKKDKSKYYGPYTSAGAVKDTIELVQKLFQIRTCNPDTAAGYRKRTSMSELSHPSVSGSLPGIYFQRGLSDTDPQCNGIVKRKF